MEFIKGILISVFVLHIIEVNTNAQSALGHNDSMSEDQQLRTMLKNVLDQNRKLALQNKRLQQVWTGMQQMCKALSMPTCDCNETGSNTPTDAHNNDAGEKDSRHNQSSLPLQVVSIHSSGETSNQTTVSIKYFATPYHTTGWFCPRINGGMWITSGRKTQATSGSSLYTSTVDIEQLQSISSLFFRLYNDEEIISVNLNLTEIEKPQHQNVTAPPAGLLQINKSYVAPLDSELNITAIVNRDARDFGYVEAFLTGLNTSAYPTIMFEITDFNDGIDVSISRRTDNTSNMDISLRYPYAQYGGKLGVLLPYRELMSGMVERYSHGPIISIYAPDTNEVMPQNTLGIFPVAKQTLIFPPAHTIICAAIGNPRPNVAFIKVDNDGKEIELETETLASDTYLSSKILTLSSKNPRKTEGHYVCRATNGNQTVNVSTEVAVLQPAVFDEHKTGVIKNTSKSIVISCKAKGKPKPEIAIHLYEKYGPDLIRSGMYKVKKTGTNTSSRVTLSISPTDAIDIHTVYCMAYQGGPDRAFETKRRVSVYPGVDKENNWELYQHVQDSQVF